MTWSNIYLFCFLVGFGLSALALLAGSVHLHLPHLHLNQGIHVPHASGGVGARGMGRGVDLSWFNFGTIAAFLAWFGGTGYLLERYYSVWFVFALGIATLSGIGASSVAFLFLAKVLMAREAALDPIDYDMTGVLGRLSIPIIAGGCARSHRLRHDRRAGPPEHSHTARRHRGADLFPGRNPPRHWRTQRGWLPDSQGRRGNRYAL